MIICSDGIFQQGGTFCNHHQEFEDQWCKQSQQKEDPGNMQSNISHNVQVWLF